MHVNKFPVVLFIMLYKVALTFESVDEILRSYPSDESSWEVLSFGTVIILYEVVLSLIIWMRSTEQYLPVMNKLVLPFKSENEILKCYFSNESHWA